jgi:hypothetical protein
MMMMMDSLVFSVITRELVAEWCDGFVARLHLHFVAS